MELSVQEFLDSVTNPNTNKMYRIGITKFCEWYEQSPQAVIELRKDDLTPRPQENIIDYRNRGARFEKAIERFHSHLLQKEYTTNSARTMTLGIRQLFRFYQMPIRMRRGSRVTKTVRTSKSFPLRIEHVRRMFQVADLRERVVLCLATDLGLRISDFVNIKKDDLPSLESEPPISFDVMTRKTEVVARGYLSGESVDLLKIYLPTLPKTNPYVFPSNSDRSISVDWLNQLLQKLAVKAQIALNGKRFSFHCFRKMFLSTSADAGMLTVGKMLCGKTIPTSDETYLTTVHLREKFMQLKQFLTIRQTMKLENHGKIESLKNVVTRLHEELTQQRIITQTVTEEGISTKQELKNLKEQITIMTESRSESDKVMNRLFEDPEFQQLIRRKIKELKL